MDQITHFFLLLSLSRRRTRQLNTAFGRRGSREEKKKRWMPATRPDECFNNHHSCFMESPQSPLKRLTAGAFLSVCRRGIICKRRPSRIRHGRRLDFECPFPLSPSLSCLSLPIHFCVAGPLFFFFGRDKTTMEPRVSAKQRPMNRLGHHCNAQLFKIYFTTQKMHSFSIFCCINPNDPSL